VMTTELNLRKIHYPRSDFVIINNLPGGEATTDNIGGYSLGCRYSKRVTSV
jgi:hypothetical protein